MLVFLKNGEGRDTLINTDKIIAAEDVGEDERLYKIGVRCKIWLVEGDETITIKPNKPIAEIFGTGAMQVDAYNIG